MLQSSRYDRPVDRRPASPAHGGASKMVGSNVSSCVEIRVESKATFTATKLRLCASVGLLGVATLATFLACVAGINVRYCNAREFRFISQECLETVEAPTVQSPALLLSTLYIISNVGEIFEGYRSSLLNRIHNTSGQDVITVLAKTVYPSAQFTQMSAGRTGAFRLKVSTKSECSLFNLTPASIPKKLSIAGYCGSDDPKVYPYHPTGKCNRFKVFLHYYMEPKAPLAVLDKIDGPLFPVQSGAVDFRNYEVDSKPTCHSGKAGQVSIEPELAGASIIADSASLRLRHGHFLALPLQGPYGGKRLGGLDPGRANQLRLEIGGFPFRRIGLVVKFHPVDPLLRPTSNTHPIKGFSILERSFIQNFFLLGVGAQSNAYGQRGHIHIVHRTLTGVKGKAPIPPPTQVGGISAQERT